MLFNHDAQYTERCTTQAERVLVTRGWFAERKNTGQCVEPVRYGKRLSGNTVRQFIAGEPWAVLFVHGKGYGCIFAIMGCVITPHGAL
jgi:hypothetical protein